MLDKKSKIVLKALNEADKNNDFHGGSEELITLCPDTLTLPMLQSVLMHLNSCGYVEGKWAGDRIYTLELTYKGKNYNEFRRIQVKEFLLRSIFTPIFVSALTTLITLWIAKLLK